MTDTTDTFDFTALIDGVSRTRTVRVVTMGGKPWFVAADACKVLDLAGYPSQHTKRLEADDVLTIDRKTRISGTRDLFGYKQPSASLISESGLYDLITRSDKPQAQPFRRWVNREVLPSIRKRGSYALPKGNMVEASRQRRQPHPQHSRRAPGGQAMVRGC